MYSENVPHHCLQIINLLGIQSSVETVSVGNDGLVDFFFSMENFSHSSSSAREYLIQTSVG